MDAPSVTIAAKRRARKDGQTSERGLSGRAMQRSEHNPQSMIFWCTLRIFAEAVLALITDDRHSRKQSLLREVLPSLPETFSRCGFRAAFLRDELASWTERARRLLRQASWHCTESGGQLVERLRQIERHARQAVDAVSALQHAAVGTTVSTQTRQNAHAGGSQPPDGIELAQLARFCQAIVELGPSETQSDPVLLQVFPTAHLLFQRCTPELLARLRSELSASESQVAGLVELAGVHWAPAADELQRSMRRTHSLAATVLDALEVLYSCSLEGVDHTSHSSKFGVTPQSPSEKGNDRTTNNRAGAEATCRMGIRSQRQGQLVAARSFYNQALTLIPDYRPALQALGQLDKLNGGRGVNAGKKTNSESPIAARTVNQDSAATFEEDILQVLAGQSRAQEVTVDRRIRVEQTSKKRDEKDDQELLAAVTPSASDAQQETPREQSTTPATAPGDPAPSEESLGEAKNGQMVIKCPNCGQQSSMRWNLMEKGKVFGCPRCQAKLAVREGGHLAKVVQGTDGTWKIDTPPPRWKDRRVVTGAIAASTLTVTVFSFFAFLGWQHVSARTSIQIPLELEPRSVALGQAWLDKDYQVLRTLTLTSQVGQLFPWLRTNPVPPTTRGVDIKARIVQQGPEFAEVELELVDPRSADLAAQKVTTLWWRDGDKWQFAPAGKTATTASNAPPGSLKTHTRQSPQQRSQIARGRKGAPYP